MYRTKIHSRSDNDPVPLLYSNGNSWTGLNNQIFALINAILRCHSNKINILICELFHTSILILFLYHFLI